MKNNYFKSIIMLLIGVLSVLGFQACQEEKVEPNGTAFEIPDLGDGIFMASGDSMHADDAHAISFKDAATAVNAWKEDNPLLSNKGFAVGNEAINLLQTFQGAVGLNILPAIVNGKETLVVFAVDAIGDLIIPNDPSIAAVQHMHAACPPFCGDTIFAFNGDTLYRSEM